MRGNFALSRSLEVLRRQHAAVRHLLSVTRASASNAANALAAASAAAANAAATAAAASAANTAAVVRPVHGACGDVRSTVLAASVADAAQRRATTSATRAIGAMRLCEAVNALGHATTREVSELRALMHSDFTAFAVEALDALTTTTSALHEQVDHASARLQGMRQERLAHLARCPSTPDGTLSSMLLHERRQLAILAQAKDVAKDLRLSALRLDALQPLLNTATLPTPRKEPSVDTMPSESGLLSVAMGAMATLRGVAARVDETQARAPQACMLPCSPHILQRSPARHAKVTPANRAG